MPPRTTLTTHCPATPFPPQTFLLWLCTFHTNLVTCWLFLSLAILFWLLAGGVGYPDQTSRVVSGCNQGLCSAPALHVAALCLCTFAWPKATTATCPSCIMAAILTLPACPPIPPMQTLTKFAGGWGFMVAAVAFYDGTAALMKDVYGKQILPVFPLKPVNKVSLGDFGTKRFVDAEKQAAA
jgi:succinate-acetate transporter protein